MVSKVEDREDVIPFETICNNHNHVVWLLQQFKRSKNHDMWYIDQAIKLTRHCKKQGQKLENRLRKWNDLVTRQMGYKRVYKKKSGKALKSWQKESH